MKPNKQDRHARLLLEWVYTCALEEEHRMGQGVRLKVLTDPVVPSSVTLVLSLISCWQLAWVPGTDWDEL